jgi:phenylacetate-CoA ligase
MSSFAETVYVNSPVWLQQVMVAAWGVSWYRRRFGGLFRKYLEEFRERDGWTLSQLEEYQDSLLADLLQAAWRSRYYRGVFESAGVREDMPPRQALGLIPLTPRSVLRECPGDLLTRDSLPRGTKVFKTSGTTGSTGSTIYYTPSYHALQIALRELRCVNVGGATYRDRRVMFGVRHVCRFDQVKPPFWRYSPMENLAYASIYHLSDRFLPHYIEFLRCYRPTVVKGYPSALHTLARYSVEHDAYPPPATCVITTSEYLSEEARKTIETAWKCRVLDEYGAVEGCVFACQCKHGRYHVSVDVGIVEILDAKGAPCPPGVSGEIVCTGLHNLLQPLIRYRIGDLASWSENQHCECGSQMPIIEGIDGRAEDMCCTPDGRRTCRFDPVFKGVTGIREAQIVQEHLSEFVIYVAADPGFGAREIGMLQEAMRLDVGDVNVRVELVDKIERSPSGKFRPVVCAVPREELEAALRNVSR